MLSDWIFVIYCIKEFWTEYICTFPTIHRKINISKIITSKLWFFIKAFSFDIQISRKDVFLKTDLCYIQYLFTLISAFVRQYTLIYKRSSFLLLTQGAVFAVPRVKIWGLPIGLVLNCTIFVHTVYQSFTSLHKGIIILNDK